MWWRWAFRGMWAVRTWVQMEATPLGSSVRVSLCFFVSLLDNIFPLSRNWTDVCQVVRAASLRQLWKSCLLADLDHGKSLQSSHGSLFDSVTCPPAAPLAAWSAALFPAIPICPGTQQITICDPGCLSLICATILWNSLRRARGSVGKLLSSNTNAVPIINFIATMHIFPWLKLVIWIKARISSKVLFNSASLISSLPFLSPLSYFSHIHFYYTTYHCNNTTEATLGATSEVRAKRVQQHAGVLAQPRLHSLGGKKIIFELTTTLYVLYASCTTCVIDLRFPEPKCGGPRGLRALSPESRTWRSEMR